MRIKKIYYLVILFVLLVNNENAHSQIIGSTTCTANLGSPIVNETFGSGAGFGPALAAGITNMQYVSFDCPNDGQYTIVNTTAGCFGSNWHATTDHTGDANGYFMLINASIAPSDFYVQTVNNLCDGTTYLFSSWVMNMDVSVGALPNITFTVEKTDGTILGTYNTGGITISNPATWNQYGFYFTTPAGISTVVLRMHNNAPGGLGNDLALDDITFSPAGPKTTIGIQGVNGDTLTTCESNIQLYSNVDICYLNNGYQWQISTDRIAWNDVAGANSATYNIPGSVSGIYLYRLTVAQAGSIGNPSCRVNSNVVKIISTSSPSYINMQAKICLGASYVLPSGKIVTAPGIYNDTLKYTAGCDSVITNIILNVLAPKHINSNASICSGQSYILPSGRSVNTSGVYNDTLKYKTGCDSVIANITLTISTPKHIDTNASICSGQSYILPSGKSVNASGVYIDTLKYKAGCDSIINSVSLNLLTPKLVDTSASICFGQSYILPSGKNLNVSGVYRDTLRYKAGCDSLITKLNLIVNSLSSVYVQDTICAGQSFTLPSGRDVNTP